MSPRELYSVVVQLYTHFENITWGRFYNFLMANTILILAWATLFASDSSEKFVFRFLLCMISFFGGATGAYWGALGYRGRQFVDKFSDIAEQLENDWPNELKAQKPLATVRAMRDDLAYGWAGSSFILPYVPVGFSVLYLVLFVSALIR